MCNTSDARAGYQSNESSSLIYDFIVLSLLVLMAQSKPVDAGRRLCRWSKTEAQVLLEAELKSAYEKGLAHVDDFTRATLAYEESSRGIVQVIRDRANSFTFRVLPYILLVGTVIAATTEYNLLSIPYIAMAMIIAGTDLKQVVEKRRFWWSIMCVTFA